ncbi:hypothetical protein HY441_01930 [Candidatus Microgenomates bacterium]|nr:hypothetical protein [Candidatus Microgenomates bacterium]
MADEQEVPPVPQPPADPPVGPSSTNPEPSGPSAPSPGSNDGPQPQAPPGGPQPPQKAGYGKRPLWFWILVYVVVGAIIYALIYWFFLRNGGGVY